MPLVCLLHYILHIGLSLYNVQQNRWMLCPAYCTVSIAFHLLVHLDRSQVEISQLHLIIIYPVFINFICFSYLLSFAHFFFLDNLASRIFGNIFFPFHSNFNTFLIQFLIYSYVFFDAQIISVCLTFRTLTF